MAKPAPPPPLTWVPTSSGQGGIISFMVTLPYVQPTQNKNSGGGGNNVAQNIAQRVQRGGIYSPNHI